MTNSDDLIGKHSGRYLKDSYDLEYFKRHAAETRAYLQANGMGAPCPLSDGQIKSVKAKACKPRSRSKPRIAYEWAVENNATAREAADKFGITSDSVYSHYTCRGLPALRQTHPRKNKPQEDARWP